MDEGHKQKEILLRSPTNEWSRILNLKARQQAPIDYTTGLAKAQEIGAVKYPHMHLLDSDDETTFLSSVKRLCQARPHHHAILLPIAVDKREYI